MCQASFDDINRELDDLWKRSRLEKLSGAEWERFYQVVVAILSYPRPWKLQGLPESAQHYMDDFFAAKVFMPAALGKDTKTPYHGGVLRKWYERYLISESRKWRTLRKHEQSERDGGAFDNPRDDEPEAFEIEYEAAATDAKAIDLDTPLPDSEESAQASGPETDAHGDWVWNPDVAAELAQHGLTVQGIGESARRFLRRQEPWVWLYLGLHDCLDDNDPAKATRQKLADQHRIRSYAYKAAKLGVVHAKGTAPPEDTLLGAWLIRELGLSDPGEHRPALMIAFKILCEAALALVESLPDQGSQP